MAVYHAESLLFGPFAERPQLSDPTIYSASGIALFLATDTGGLYETSGSAWTLLGTLIGVSLPGVASDGANGVLAQAFTIEPVVSDPASGPTLTPVLGASVGLPFDLPPAATYEYCFVWEDSGGNQTGVSPTVSLALDGTQAAQWDVSNAPLGITAARLYRRDPGGDGAFHNDGLNADFTTPWYDGNSSVAGGAVPSVFNQTQGLCVFGPVRVQGALQVEGGFATFDAAVPDAPFPATINVASITDANARVAIGQLIGLLNISGEYNITAS